MSKISIDISALPPLALPPFAGELRRCGPAPEIYDFLRRRWVVLTPEEWVRQNFTAFLRDCRGWPEARMANEVGLRFNGMVRRCDTVLFDRGVRPLAIVEYKRPSVEITQKVFDQIARYNSVMQAPFLVVSNGLRHFCVRYTPQGYAFLPDIPRFGEMPGN